MSAAVDVYSACIRFEKKLRIEALRLSPIEQLADVCPRCFGPTVSGKSLDEPDCIISLDGNFQHQRHEASSAEDPATLRYPPIFIEPEELTVWKTHLEDLRSSGTGRAPAAVRNHMPTNEFIVSPVLLTPSFPMAT